jgi:hypothetical protein
MDLIDEIHRTKQETGKTAPFSIPKKSETKRSSSGGHLWDAGSFVSFILRVIAD